MRRESGPFDPFGSFNFVVEIEGITSAGFSECTGLDSESDVVEYREGSDDITVRKLPGLKKFSNVTLKRGVSTNTDLFGITDIRLDAAQNGTLAFTADMGDANADNGFLDGNETFTYALYDSATTPAVGNLDLGRTVGTVGVDPTELVAAGIEALGFAFAFDADADGRLDFNDINGNGEMDPPNEGIYWAVDSDGDNDLDLELDTNKDGDVNTADVQFVQTLAPRFFR